MKGKMKKALCGVLTAVMLLSVPAVAQAETIIVAGIETEVGHSQPIKPEYSKTNTKAKTVTLYAGLRYTFRGYGFKRAKAQWKISNTKYATISSRNTGAAIVTAKKAGKFTVTAKQGSRKYTYRVTIKEDFQKHFLDTKAKGDTLTWNRIPGADGYLVCLKYYSEDGSDFNGMKDGDIIKIKDMQGNSEKSYKFSISSIPNWIYYRNHNCFLRVKPYKNINGKIVFSTEYPEDMTFNNVRLR
ncbi:MAG: Ig-like domain-containing protein [Blautia sp.]|jgi:hypothetical protein